MDLDPAGEWALPKRAGHVDFAYRWQNHAPLDADISVFLLVGGKVRSNDDFIFYSRPPDAGQPVDYPGKVTGPDGLVTDSVTVHLTRLDARVDGVLFAVSVDGPVGAALTDLGSISATFAASTGPAIVEIGPDPGVTAVAAIEIVRQGTHWVARAAGRAYSDGLAALARDCGVKIASPDAGPGADPATVAADALLIDWTRPPVPTGYEPQES